MQPVMHFWGIQGTCLQTPTNRILRSGRWSMGIPAEPELDQKMPVRKKMDKSFSNYNAICGQLIELPRRMTTIDKDPPHPPHRILLSGFKTIAA